MEGEIYIPINDFPNYSISNLGNVKNNRTGRILKPGINDKGYLTVVLYEKGEKKSKYIHILVANEFIPNPQNKPFIDHIDGNRTTNTLSNLRWATRNENGFNQTKQERVTSSTYKGVCFHKKQKKWNAVIRKDRKLIHIGSFDNETEAALAYNEKAVELFGEYAKLNVIPDN